MIARRDILGSGLIGAAALAGGARAATEATGPRLELALEIIADIAPVQDLGSGPLGTRRIVPILGGTFEAKGSLAAGLKGVVLPGGADRQLIRTDGVRQLSALYELRADNGDVITVLNKVLVEDKAGGRYAFSTPEITAPKGPSDWLNHHVFLGTLDSLKPARSAVLIRFYRVY
ncbi:DUF3237 domain-containing protein [Novosphingobium sp. KACC 22771]|uniref:DUF3237 domain-containing protein n=1 Tax=Novosphingobium sp. KACC 22771 TaxID=3025670 RepID=UPI002365F221|nr:DUF3237 domain-containing protein [Novosphingobium sp. KACC 22771]WDF73438.1 DUF3237 domain-containing protein [Novosphingobium sp. KACC 22771]